MREGHREAAREYLSRLLLQKDVFVVLAEGKRCPFSTLMSLKMVMALLQGYLLVLLTYLWLASFF